MGLTEFFMQNTIAVGKGGNNETEKQYDCNLVMMNDLIGGKWKLRILWHIMNGDNRFSMLEKI